MNTVDIIGYAAAVSFVIYFLSHLFETLILKKKFQPRTFDMVYYFVLCIAVLIYVIAGKDYPLIIVFSIFIIWAILGWMDKRNKK